MNLTDLLAYADQSINSLPLATHVLAAVGLVAGVVLWLMGRKVLRPIFCILGCVGGGAIGFFLMAQTRDTMFGVPSPYIGLVIGAALGLGTSIMLFRFAVAISCGLALGLAGIMISAAYLNFRPAPVPTVPTPASLSAPGFQPLNRTSVVEAAKPMAKEVQEFIEAKWRDIRAAWSARSEQDRVTLGVSGLGAAVAGFVLGLFAPRRSAAISTALFGSAVGLASAAWIAEAAQVPGHKYLDQSAVVWLVIWLVVAAAGVMLQVTSLRKTPAPAT